MAQGPPDKEYTVYMIHMPCAHKYLSLHNVRNLFVLPEGMPEVIELGIFNSPIERVVVVLHNVLGCVGALPSGTTLPDCVLRPAE